MASNLFNQFMSKMKETEKEVFKDRVQASQKDIELQIMSSASVRLSVAQNDNYTKEDDSPMSTLQEAILEGVNESIEANQDKIIHKIDELFSDKGFSAEMEARYMQKLCSYYNINPDLSKEEKIALLDKELSNEEDLIYWDKQMDLEGFR